MVRDPGRPRRALEGRSVVAYHLPQDDPRVARHDLTLYDAAVARRRGAHLVTLDGPCCAPASGAGQAIHCRVACNMTNATRAFAFCARVSTEDAPDPSLALPRRSGHHAVVRHIVLTARLVSSERAGRVRSAPARSDAAGRNGDACRTRRG